ncbi:MAG TPA: hypothetical protein PLX65_07745, partial [Accumulibacter sp.]|nr:hypothetical protein [Accumulibacter sp.]
RKLDPDFRYQYAFQIETDNLHGALPGSKSEKSGFYQIRLPWSPSRCPRTVFERFLNRGFWCLIRPGPGA